MVIEKVLAAGLYGALSEGRLGVNTVRALTSGFAKRVLGGGVGYLPKTPGLPGRLLRNPISSAAGR